MEYFCPLKRDVLVGSSRYDSAPLMLRKPVKMLQTTPMSIDQILKELRQERSKLDGAIQAL
jgi:hypothetical protein